ncbi:hypothetical protein PUN28_014007 [Cardiocondyla obscurior]|uniref:Uncharacterized protein n=2 Tax=Cardiocondyla obscurior TaxID=286306 RepID=A0AAW2F4C1_9HYME
MPESPKKNEIDDEAKPATDFNNTPKIIAETVFPPGTPGILKNITSPHSTGQPEAKTKHITSFVLRPWILHRIKLKPPRLTRPPRFFLQRPYDQRIWRDTTPNWSKPLPALITSLGESVGTQTKEQQKHRFLHAPQVNDKGVQIDAWKTTSAS